MLRMARARLRDYRYWTTSGSSARFIFGVGLPLLLFVVVLVLGDDEIRQKLRGQLSGDSAKIRAEEDTTELPSD